MTRLVDVSRESFQAMVRANPDWRTIANDTYAPHSMRYLDQADQVRARAYYVRPVMGGIVEAHYQLAWDLAN